MKIRLLSILLTLVAAPAILAQTWQAALDDDGGYAYGYAQADDLPMGFACTVRSVQNRPLIEVGAHEEQPTAPYNMRIEFWGPTIPETGVQTRTDMALWVDDTGYQLPPVVRDEFYGYWWVELSMGDPLYRALGSASRLVLAVGQDAVWDVPVGDLGLALTQAQQHCAATLVATGNPAPAWFGPVPAAIPQAAAPAAPTSSDFTVPQQVIAHANRLCQGVATIDPQAFLAGDFDGDSVPDVVMDWNHVMCPPPMGRGFCGAANCSVDVFMSSKGYADPEQMLGAAPTLARQPDGRMGLMITGSFSLCGQNGENCARPWVWNGQALVRR